jgi:hypothetical protein
MEGHAKYVLEWGGGTYGNCVAGDDLKRAEEIAFICPWLRTDIEKSTKTQIPCLAFCLFQGTLSGSLFVTTFVTTFFVNYKALYYNDKRKLYLTIRDYNLEN